MAPNFVQVPPNSTGVKMQTYENTIAGNVVDSEAVTLTNSSGIEEGTSGNPVRVDPTGTTTQPVTGTGVAGTPAAGVVSIQGVGGGTAIPISGTIIATLGTITDSAPATQNITAQDVASTTTAVANGQNFITGAPTANSAATFALGSGFDSADIQVTGVWTGTVAIESSMDGGITYTALAVHQPGTSFTIASATANFAAMGLCAAATHVRVRATAAWTGTATVRAVFSINAAMVTVKNPIRLQDSTTQSISNTIKAASTAAIATDTALVVAISPNNTVPVSLTSTTITGTVAVTESGTWTVSVVGNAGGAFDGLNGSPSEPPNTLQVGGWSGGQLLPIVVSSSPNGYVGMAGAHSGVATPVAVDAAGNLILSSTNPNGINILQIAGNAVSTAASGIQKVGIVGSTGGVVDFAGQNAAQPANSILIGGEFNTAPTTITNGNASPLQLSATGSLLTLSNIRTTSTNSATADNTANVVLLGDNASVPRPLYVAQAAYGGAFSGAANAALSGWSKVRTPTVFKTVSVSAATTGNSAVWTPGSGNKFRLLTFQITAQGLAATASGVVTVSFQDASTGITFGTYDVDVPAVANVASGVNQISGFVQLGTFGILSAAANNVLNFNISAAGAGTVGTYRVNVSGTEE